MYLMHLLWKCYAGSSNFRIWIYDIRVQDSDINYFFVTRFKIENPVFKNRDGVFYYKTLRSTIELERLLLEVL